MPRTKVKKSKKGMNEHERMEALLEAIQSDFQAFGEGLEMLDQKVTRGFGETNKDMDHVKAELALIRHDLKQKIDRAEFKLLEARVSRLETAIRK